MSALRITVRLTLIMACLTGAFACSASHAAKHDELPNCLDLCGRVNAERCSERHPGDYTACANVRRQCDQECRAQHAESEASQSQPLSPDETIPSVSAQSNQEEETEVPSAP